MGKTRRKRNARLDGMIGDVIHSEAELETPGTLENVVDSVIQSILDQLQSPKAEDRDCGANALATLPQDKKDVLLVIRTGIVRACAPLLLDKNAAVRHSAAGALRNLSTVGGEEACEAMVSQDVLTPLVAFIKKFPSNWTPAKKTIASSPGKKSARIDSSEQQLIEAVTLLWNLCESSPTAVEICNNDGVVDTLKAYLDLERFGKGIVLAVENCLYTLTENNKDAVEKLKTEDAAVLRLLSWNVSKDGPTVPSDNLVRILASGITYNLCDGLVNSQPESVQALIGESITTALAPSCIDALSSFSSLIGETQTSGEEGGQNAEEEKIYEDEIQNLEDLFSSQNSALMLVANLCCSAESEDWEDVSSDESEITSENDEGMHENVIEEKSVLPETVLKIFRGDLSSGSHIIQMILSKTLPLPEGLKKPAGRHGRRWKGLIERTKVLRSDAFLCLANLIPVFTVEDFGGAPLMFEAWCDLNRMIFQSNEVAADLTLAEAAVNAIRSLTEKIKEASPKSFENLTTDDITTLCTAVFPCPEPSVRASMVRILACIGVSLGGNPAEVPSEKSREVIKILGSCLLQVIMTDSQLWVVAEALDAIYDVFAEDHINNIAHEIGLLATLKSVVGPLKQKVNKEKKSLGEHLAIVTTAKLNLNRFIKYKMKNM